MVSGGLAAGRAAHGPGVGGRAVAERPIPRLMTHRAPEDHGPVARTTRSGDPRVRPSALERDREAIAAGDDRQLGGLGALERLAAGLGDRDLDPGGPARAGLAAALGDHRSGALDAD